MGVVFLLLFQSLFLCAQSETRADTTVALRYQLDTLTATDTVEEIAQEDYVVESDTETKNDPEYFLRKEFTGGFGDTLQLRKVPDTVLKTLQNDKAFWYANKAFKKKANESKAGDPFTAHPFFQIILWLVIIAGFLTFLILYLQNSNVRLFRKTSSNIDIDEEGKEQDDIFSINYTKEIAKAESMSNYRLAVRLLFLRLLKDLSDKNIIQYKPDNTNFDYLAQLYSTEKYQDFFRITRHYEYSWYGQFDIDKEKFAVIKNDFKIFETKINQRVE